MIKVAELKSKGDCEKTNWETFSAILRVHTQKITFLAIFCSSLLFSGDSQCQSFENEINQLIEQSEAAAATDTATILSSLRTARQIAIDKQLTGRIAELNWRMAVNYKNQQKYPIAQELLEHALTLLKKQSNDTLTLHILDDLTATYYWQHQAKPAMQTAEKGLHLAEKLDTTHYQITFLLWFGAIFEVQQQWENAIFYYEKVLKIAKEINNPVWQYYIYRGLGSTYMKKGVPQTGLNFLDSCKFLVNKIPNSRLNLAEIWLLEGGMYNTLGQYSQAVMSFNQAIAVFDSLQIPKQQMHVRLELGRLFLDQKEFAKSIAITKEALNLYPEGLTPYENQFANDLLYYSYRGLGDYENALYYIERIRQEKAILDSISSQTAINEIEARYQRKEQDQIIEQQQLTLQLERRTRTGFIIGLLFLGLLLLGTFFIINYLNRTRKRLAKQNALIAKQSDELQKLDRVKDDFLANVSHEIRTPLTVILGVSKLKDSYLAGQNIIQHSAWRLLRLVNQLLDFSKLDAGNLVVHREPTDITALLTLLVQAFQPLATEKKIALEFISNKEQLIGLIDAAKFEQIINNLISNAIKFTLPGGSIELNLNYQDGQLMIKISDTGIGIAPKVKEIIFDRFQRGSSNETVQGAGIGLALVKELIELMNGDIAVESTLGVGSNFTLILPVKEVAKTAEMGTSPIGTVYSSKPVMEIQKPLTKRQSKEQALVLVVEDDPNLTQYLQVLLKSNYQVITAVNGATGIDFAIEHIPDIIISDVQMPLKDGFELVQTLKQDERTNHIPIILLTARAMQPDRLLGLEYGADAYLTKPFDSAELFVRLNKLLEIRKILQNKYAVPLVSSSSTEDSPRAEPEFLQRVRTELEKDLGKVINVEELASLLHLTKMQLYRKIKALTGNTPTQYINQIRLEHAARLLKETNQTVSEIAYEVGYTDPKYFSRIFAKLFKKSPTAYRSAA